MSSHSPLRRLTRRSALWALALATAVGVVTIGLLASSGTPASAAPVAQCNSEQNAGAQGVRCTTTVVNYLTASGALSVAPPSTVTVTRCVGTAAQISANSGTCTTATTVSTTPVANVEQCNAVSGGGGGVAICVTNVTNHFATAPAGAFTPATVYQCVGSFVGAFASPPAAGSCQPANTGGGITSVALATVGQCVNSANGSNGGVSYMCMTVAGSTTTTTFPMHIDQCNGSVNGADPVVRAAVLTCYATVTNDVLAIPTPTATATSTATATATPTSTPSGCTPAGTGAGSGGAGAGGAGAGGAGAGGAGAGGAGGGAISLDRADRPGRGVLSAAQIMCDPTPTPTATPTVTPTVTSTVPPTPTSTVIATATATSTGTPTACPAGTPCVVTTSSCVGPCSTTTPGCAGPCITTTTTGCAGPCITTTTTGCAGGPCSPTTTTGCAGGPCSPTTTTSCSSGPCTTTATTCATSCTTTTTTSTQCTGACTAVTTATSCTGACTSSLVEVASNGQQSPRAVPRPAATGKGRTSDSTPVGLVAGLVLAAGTLTSLGAYAVRRRRP